MHPYDRTTTAAPRHRSRRVAVLASTLLLAGGIVALGGPVAAADGPAIRSLDITATDSAGGSIDSYVLSTDRVTAGLVDVRLHNTGSVDHQAQLVRLHDGVTPAQYLAALEASGGGTALVLGDATGGPNAIHAGGFQETWVTLVAGTYGVLCFQDGPGGPPHFVKGMYASFAVSGQGNSAHPPGNVVGTISAFSFGFHMPAVIDGHGLYRFTNSATADTHELTIIKLAPGATAADALAWIQNPSPAGPPPFAEADGGGGAIAPGAESWVRLDLAPGDYIAVCFVPDDEAPHAPHAALGMVQGFHVAG
ncbi:MAG TPA: hypothetical protein VFL59_08505 [Candidatus Nanopelagicales bacterium]|nr:hypothetical protein [Candidatus Nanopelagicales bacterium]